ncbi:MAG: RNA polymerase sporulation sigma factor SigH [Firmicutes bacterium]|nr:RNA polymerase sporulation sigma factor SigH [Bacillota bacterium]
MEFSSLHILTDEQLVKMAQEGSETAEEILIEKYKGFVKNKAKSYYIAGADSEDVVQEGMIGLFKAIRGFDANKEAAFKTFADTCVNNQIMTAIKKANRQKHQPLNESLSLSREVDGGDEGPDMIVGDLMKASMENEPEALLLLQEAVETLKAHDSGMFSAFEWQVWTEKLKGHSYVEIAEILGKSPKSIDNAIQRIKKKIVAYLEK